jgi:hypothetical protein
MKNSNSKLNSPINNNDEYTGLSYKNNSNTSIRIKECKENEGKKKLNDNGFRIKYKTEICKYWEVHKTCTYGDTVLKINKVCICSWNSRYKE